jgi:hypothetical protein
MRHADVLRRAFLDEADALDAAVVARKSQANIVKEAAVDFVNDFEMARQEMLNHCTAISPTLREAA